MSLQKPSSFDLSLRQNIISFDRNERIEAGKPHNKPCDMMTLYQRAGNLRYGHNTYVQDPTLSAKVLHESEHNLPAITLTTYKGDSLTRSSLQQLFQKVEPSHGENIAASLKGVFADTTAQVDEDSKDLMRELVEHFGELKSEFEEKTGRPWTPLRAWEKED